MACSVNCVAVVLLGRLARPSAAVMLPMTGATSWTMLSGWAKSFLKENRCCDCLHEAARQHCPWITGSHPHHMQHQLTARDCKSCIFCCCPVLTKYGNDGRMLQIWRWSQRHRALAGHAGVFSPSVQISFHIYFMVNSFSTTNDCKLIFEPVAAAYGWRSRQAFLAKSARRTP